MNNKKIIAILGLVAVTSMHCGASKKQNTNVIEQVGQHIQDAIKSIAGNTQGSALTK